jgi:hypothetical protein
MAKRFRLLIRYPGVRPQLRAIVMYLPSCAYYLAELGSVLADSRDEAMGLWKGRTYDRHPDFRGQLRRVWALALGFAPVNAEVD